MECDGFSSGEKMGKKLPGLAFCASLTFLMDEEAVGV